MAHTPDHITIRVQIEKEPTPTQLPPGDYSTPDRYEEIPAEIREHIEHSYANMPDRHVMSMAAAADSPFPYSDGEVTVLGPEVFHDETAGIIMHKGQNYVRQGQCILAGNCNGDTCGYPACNDYPADHPARRLSAPPLPQRIPGANFRDHRAFDMLRQVFDSQAHFQRLLGHEYDEMSPEERVGYLKDQILALLDESHEALNEIGWKPWASSRHINRDEFAGELADILCFLINLALGVGLTADDFYRLHQEKALRNIKRQEAKYDGVTGKCPGCKRAIDDLRAKGIPVGNFGGVDYCSPECIEKMNPTIARGTVLPFHTNQAQEI
jgi:hypothetical protein